VPLDESCYREVKNTDVFVLIVGGRYGSERSGGQDRRLSKDFFDRYDSVTKMEYRAAVASDIPVYIFVERAVYAEYQTFLRNKGTNEIKYAHVDSVNIFLLLEEILAQPRNNPVKEFDRYEDIERWLREQWAGLFKDMLQRISGQKQLASLQQEVANIAAIGNTLQSYLEVLVKKASPQRATSLIGQEQQKQERARQKSQLRSNVFVEWLTRRHEIPFSAAVEALRNAQDFYGLLKELAGLKSGDEASLGHTILTNRAAQSDANEARSILGLPPFPLTVERPPGSEIADATRPRDVKKRPNKRRDPKRERPQKSSTAKV
jgi:hypothetical protein